jgi:hypothetical protein
MGKMSIERFEIRFCCAIGMAIYIHLTAHIWYGLFSILVLCGCLAYAYMPVWANWADERHEHTKAK